MVDLGMLWFMLTIFGMLVLAGIGAPIPEELAVVMAGVWVGVNPELGPFRWLILPLCFAGVLISDVLLYGIGRAWGVRLLEHQWAARWLPRDKRAQIEHNFQHYGLKVLLLIRWVPAIRSPMFITVGMMRVPLLRFVIADGIALVMGHTVLFFLAYWFGDQFLVLVQKAESWIDWLKPLLILTLILAVALGLLLHYWRRPVQVADPSEMPLIPEKVAATIESVVLPSANCSPPNPGAAQSEPPESARAKKPFQ